MLNQETMNVQFLNQSFLDKIDQGLTKEASVAMSAFVRQKLREDGFTRKILLPSTVTSAELDRQLTDEPTVIIEKEPDSVAANLPLTGRSEIQYFDGPRYAVTFGKIESKEFKKSKYELATYRTDIRTILQENSVKDLQEQEDENFFNKAKEIANANGNYTAGQSASLTPKDKIMTVVKAMLARQVPVGTILVSQGFYADLLKSAATDIGSPLASDLITGRATIDNPFGYRLVTTIKRDLLGLATTGTAADGDKVVAVFAPPQYLGQMLLLQDAMVYLKVEADIISFKTYEAVGAGIGNVNGVSICVFNG